MADLKARYQRKGELIHQMKDIYTQAEKRGDGLTDEEQGKWDKFDAEFRSVQELIDKGEKLKAMESEHEKRAQETPADIAEQRDALASREPAKINKSPEADKPKVTYRSAWHKWASHGPSSLTREERDIMSPGRVKGGEIRGILDQVSDVAGLGGYLSPETWADQVVESMVAFGGMLEAGTIINTKGGDVFHIPTEDTTAQVGAIIGQAVADIVQDVTWGEKTMSAFTYTSNIIKIAEELYAEDDAFNVLSRVEAIAARRVGRKLNSDLTIGAGTTLPFGVHTRATDSSVVGASATAVGRAELIRLIHSVDPAYRGGQKTGFMFSDATLSGIRQLSIGSADDRPLWVPSMREGVPDTIEGERYFVNQDIPDMASTVKSILYGDFSKYWIRRVRGMKLSRSDQRFWDERVVAYFLTARFDGELTDTAAIKFFTNAT